MGKRLRTICLLLIFLGLSLIVIDHGFLEEARAQTISTVYITPVPAPSLAPGPSSTVTLSVRMSLASGETINGFDVRLNYTGWTGPVAILDALSVDSSNNIFAGLNFATTARCADGIVLESDGFCPTDDSPSGGQVHLAENLFDPPLSGPLVDQLLFRIVFAVNGTGTVLFTLDRAHLLNPGTVQSPNPHFVQVVTRASVFGNSDNQVVAFFDFEPTIPPAILPGQDVAFNASASFRVGSSLTNPSYSWSFGDGKSDTGPRVLHRFASPGNYSVRLSVTDSSDGSDWIVRTVAVSPLLGGLEVRVRNQLGSPIRWLVRVLVYNSSDSSLPALNKTVDGAGIVLFSRLSPGVYLLRFSGPTVDPDTKQLKVIAGWTNQETVYLNETLPSPPGNLPEIIFFGSILGGLGVVGTALVFQRRRVKRARMARPGVGRGRRMAGSRTR